MEITGHIQVFRKAEFHKHRLHLCVWRYCDAWLCLLKSASSCIRWADV